MSKGTTLVYRYGEQGYPYVIACIHSANDESEKELLAKMVKLLGHELTSRELESVKYINHTHIYANRLLGNEPDKDTLSLLRTYFPEAASPDFDRADSFAYTYQDGKAHQVEWMNRYHNDLTEHMNKLLHEAADAYKEHRSTR